MCAIKDVLSALEESPPGADKQAIWEAIQQKRRHLAGRARTVFRRIAACAAILVFFLIGHHWQRIRVQLDVPVKTAGALCGNVRHLQRQ